MSEVRRMFFWSHIGFCFHCFFRFFRREEEGFEHRRPREPHALDDYNADEDEYEMVVEPELPDVLARKEMQMIQKQMAQLSSRLQREGRFFFCGK